MKLAGMEAELRSNTAKKEQLEADIVLCSVKLERAEKLLGGLAGEQARWTAAAAQLRADARHVIGDALLSAAVMAYLGPFTPLFRQRLLAGFCAACDTASLPRSTPFSLAGCLGEPARTRGCRLLR